MFEFPPLNVAGIYRQVRFANALASAGYNVNVLTIELTKEYLAAQKKIDYSLLNLVNPNINIIRVPINKINPPNNSIGSFYSSWRNSAGDRLYDHISATTKNHIHGMMQSLSIDLLLVSSPPFSLTVLAEELSKKFNLPLIIDMRDAWTGWTMVPFPSYDYFLRRKWLERKVLKQATVITSVTNELIERYKDDHPQISPDKFQLIYNSPNKKLELKDEFQLVGLDKKERLNIGYTGSFYYTPPVPLEDKLKKPHRLFQYQRKLDDWKYRSPFYFFRTLSRLFEKTPALKKKVYFHYIGEPEKWIIDMINDFNLNDNVICHGFLKYADALAKEKDFDLLLATSEKTTRNNHFCLPSKIFNYLASSKPILAFVTDGPQKDLIQNVNCGIIFNPDMVEESCELLKETIENGLNLTINKQALEKYQMVSTNSAFTQLVNKVINPTNF
ncbi:MAG: glycosyltransferase [Brumimicrobium sp.]|nr:glycosyltransferase [Brumimicrobium sp.]